MDPGPAPVPPHERVARVLRGETSGLLAGLVRVRFRDYFDALRRHLEHAEAHRRFLASPGRAWVDVVEASLVPGTRLRWVASVEGHSRRAVLLDPAMRDPERTTLSKRVKRSRWIAVGRDGAVAAVTKDNRRHAFVEFREKLPRGLALDPGADPVVEDRRAGRG